MGIRVVRLGSPRARGEGLRIGTVRRPPRGVPRSQLRPGDWYDVWLPLLSPSPAAIRLAQAAATEKAWAAFGRRYGAEMARPDASRLLDLLAALSHQTDLAVGCYCEEERRCHRSLLRELLASRGAQMR